MKIIKINNNDTNIRLDNFLCKVCPNISLSQIYKFIRTKKIKVNNKKTENNYRLQLNDEISLYLVDDFFKTKNDIQNKNNIYMNANKNIDIIYEDENLIVVNKPINLLVYDEKNEKQNTLINQIKRYLFEQKKWNPNIENQFEPALLHRLDFNTSGLVMAAKNHSTLSFLNEKIKNREVDKYYICAVYGKMERREELITHFWTKDKSTNIVKISNSQLPWSIPIKTFYKLLKYLPDQNISILEVKLITGKTHQIRAHMAHIGHPLLGEQKYSNKFIEKKNEFNSQVLISYKIIFNFLSTTDQFKYLNKKTITLRQENNFLDYILKKIMHK